MRGSVVVFLSVGLPPLTAMAAEIHDAAKDGDVAAIAALLDAGADINESDGLATPLVYAVNRVHLEAAALLIAYGADVDAQSRIGGSPLLTAASKGQPEMIELLLSHGADPNLAPGQQSPIHAAVKQGCLDCVTALVEAGADVNARTSDAFARTPIHMATSNDDTAMVDYLMAHGVVLPVPEPISGSLNYADPERGAEVFGRNCDGCHSTEQGNGNKIGPNLWGVLGRDKASVPGFDYSATLERWEGSWTYEDLNILLYDPILTTPGVRMEMPGVHDYGERADVIVYLRSLSDVPMPLP